VICCSFVFEPGEYDADFHRLNDEIDAFAKALEGYVRVDSWRNADGSVRNSMYFFENYQAVKALAQYPAHLEAKGEVARWYKSYRIDVFELKTSYGSK